MTYQKDFDERSKDKKFINNSNRIIYPHSKEIWNVKLGTNIWFEEDGKGWFLRPVLVIKKIWNLYFILPLTTKWKSNNIFYHDIISIDFGKPSSVMLSQARTIDSKRFILKIWQIDNQEYIKIKNTLQRMYL